MLPIKTYIDIGFGLIVVAFLWFVYHEGEKRIEDADVRAAQAQVIHNEEVNKAAQSAIAAAQADYNAKLSAVTVAPVHVSVCQPAHPRAVPSTAVVGSAAGTGRPDGASSVSQAVGSEGYDIGPFTDQLLDEADAQIAALQAIIRAQQQQMEQAHAR